MGNVALDDKIPNNVNLSSDRKLKKALESWQPNFIDWWMDMGPEGFQQDQIYLRTAISVERGGWAHFDYVKMPDYRWGIFLTPPEENRTIPFGDELGKPVWDKVPGDVRKELRRIARTDHIVRIGRIPVSALVETRTAQSHHDTGEPVLMCIDPSQRLTKALGRPVDIERKDRRIRKSPLLIAIAQDRVDTAGEYDPIAASRTRCLETIVAPDNIEVEQCLVEFGVRAAIGSQVHHGIDPLASREEFVVLRDVHRHEFFMCGKILHGLNIRQPQRVTIAPGLAQNSADQAGGTGN